MSNPFRSIKFAWACTVSIAALAWVMPSVSAQVRLVPAQGQGQGQAQAPSLPSPPRIYYKSPVTTASAATWVKLGRKAEMPFRNETPLEEFIKYIKTASADKNDRTGLKIYVDPVGLSEAEKTMASPITLDLGTIKLETALNLALAQLDLCFYVKQDGILVITSRDSKNEPGAEPNALILDRLDALRAEVNLLRKSVNARR